MRSSWLCRIGIHHFVDFPDPNPEAGGLESMGYQACTRCTKERDRNLYQGRGYSKSYPPRRERGEY
jgi:hypothetical protein